jgi:hypothetical protein
MQKTLSQDGLFINDFHRSSSMAALREVQRMSLHPYSREQMLQQINSLRRSAVSKETSKHATFINNVVSQGCEPYRTV